MSSWSDPAGIAGASEPQGVPRADGATDATVELWDRRAQGVSAPRYAAALTGADPERLAGAAAISLAGSPEASRLVEEMGTRIRMLNTTVTSHTERCEYSVRGPVLWSETLTARANSLGSEDVFICATSHRTFDTVENRVLVAALDAIAAAGRALQGPLRDRLAAGEAERIAEVAEQARRWRRNPRLERLRAGRITTRDIARVRGGHRLSRMAPVLAVRDRAAEPFTPDDVGRLADPGTRVLHRFAATVLRGLERHGLAPVGLSVDDRGALVGGGFSFRHPVSASLGPVGVRYRGVPLLPSPELRDGSEWWAALPTRGITIEDEGDVARFLERLDRRDSAGGSGGRSTAPGQRSASPSAYSSSSSSE